MIRGTETRRKRGEHIHHGYWPTPESKTSESKEQAQINLIRLLLASASLPPSPSPSPLRVLDVGCGLGGTSRYLATTLGCSVTGITISPKQVEMATRLSKTEAEKNGASSAVDAEGFISLGGEKGKVRFLEMDAEKMDREFEGKGFDVVWISEALSHIPGKDNFFGNAFKVLREGGKLVIADWFKAEGLEGENADIKAIEGGYFSVLSL